MSILIKNTRILTQNNQRKQCVGNIYIDDDIISQISTKPVSIEADYIIDGTKKLVLPGFVNLHTHIPMTLFRGYGDDMILQNWLEERIWPAEAKLNKHTIQVGTQLGLLEMITSGTTSYLDMYFFEDVIAEVTQNAGLRGFLGFALIDFDTPEYSKDQLVPRCDDFIRKWKNNSLISPVVAPHSTYSCNPETLHKAHELATKHNVYLHTHCSETRDEVYDVQKRYQNRPVEHLKKQGLLTKNMILAHCGWITKNEILDIKTAGASVVHCPISNMKIATGGYAPIPELLDAGVSVGLGTDGAASNNILDMFDTMKFCALVHKQHRWDPKVLPAQTVLDCATITGAHCLGQHTMLGSIEEGKKADLAIVDLHKPHLTPLHDTTSHMVYAARGHDVCTTIVNGKPLMLDYKLLTLDPETIMTAATECAQQLTN